MVSKHAKEPSKNSKTSLRSAKPDSQKSFIKKALEQIFSQELFLFISALKLIRNNFLNPFLEHAAQVRAEFGIAESTGHIDRHGQTLAFGLIALLSPPDKEAD